MDLVREVRSSRNAAREELGRYRVNRKAAVITLLAASIALTGALTGCAQQSPAQPAASEQAEASTKEAPEQAPEVWERFTDPRIPHSFELPPGWSVTELGADPATDSYLFGVLNPAGEQKLQFSNRAQGMGGSCGPADPVLELEELDSREVELPGYVAAAPDSDRYAAPRIVFQAAPVDGAVVASLSLADSVPLPGCMQYNLLQVEQGPALFTTNIQLSSYSLDNQWVFASIDEAKAYAETEEYEQLVRVLGSLSFTA